MASVKVFTATHNVDDMFAIDESKDPEAKKNAFPVPKRVGALRDNIFAQINARVKEKHDVIILHFQEVTSAAGAVNGIKNAFSLTEIDILTGNAILADQSKLIDPKNAFAEEKKMAVSSKNLFNFSRGLLSSLNGASMKMQLAAISQYEALANIVLVRSETDVSYKVSLIKKKNFGEYYKVTFLNNFGFKGLVALRIARYIKTTPERDILAINFHLSSKSYKARMEMISHSMEKVFKYLFKHADFKDFQAIPGAVLFFGDFNARTGANFKGVDDGDYYLPTNELSPIFKECINSLPPSDFNNPRSKQKFPQTKIHNNGITLAKLCPNVYDRVDYFDEYRQLFEFKQEILNTTFNCEHLLDTKKVSKDTLNVVFSPIKEGVKDFGPTFCLNKDTKKFGCHKEKEIISFTDRIFFAQKAIAKIDKDKIVSYSLMEISMDYYKFNDMGFISDHGMVFGEVNLGAVGVQASDKAGKLLGGKSGSYSPFFQESAIKFKDKKEWDAFCKEMRDRNINISGKENNTNDMMKHSLEEMVSSMNWMKEWMPTILPKKKRLLKPLVDKSSLII